MEKFNYETKLAFEDMRRDLIRYILIGLLCTLIGLITPLITKSFVDGIIPLAARNQAVQICILVFVCNISVAIGSLSKYLANLRMETRAGTDLEAAFMARLLKLPVGFFKNYSSGELASRIAAVSVIRKKGFNIVFTLLLNFVFSFVYILQARHYCPQLVKTGILLALIPILVGVITGLATFNLKESLKDIH